MQASESVTAFGVLLEWEFHHPYTHILYLYKHRSNRACCKVLRLQECTHGANPHTCTHFSCMAQLKMGTKDSVRSMCHYHRSMSRIQVTLLLQIFSYSYFNSFFSTDIISDINFQMALSLSPS